MKNRTTLSFVFLTVLTLVSCTRAPEPGSQAVAEPPAAKPTTGAAPRSPGGPDPCAIVLAPHRGEGRTDQEIARLQEELGRAPDSGPLLERLGWLFVRKARESFDPGFYRLAEQCALCLDSRRPDSLEAMLLRGHVLQNLHRFKEAEPLARALVARRGLAFDHGLLGDVLMEQGRLREAAEAYQKMMDLKPDPHAYARAAHLRWLKGDLPGALEAMQMAAAAASPHDPESAAWSHARLAFYQFQSGATTEVEQACAAALEFQKDYPPALLLRGRLRLAADDAGDAVEPLQRAAQLNPLPEYQWTLAEALREADRAVEAQAVEARLRQSGAADDARTAAVFFATRGEAVEAALRLTEEELRVRSDVFTHDARAWALAAAGRFTEAQPHIDQALAEGTADARLFFHATVIAAQTGQREQARRWFDRATDLMHLLLPSEREQLLRAATVLEDDAEVTAASR
ncbi:MAG: tetratricopeptide repeat protein [Verrucomicrobia bacterium]|nr:tetratricopeptide repeat protein [Verrucomicrobiota bacterium]